MKKTGPGKSALQGLHLHFDPVSGVAGDMAVAALVDVGVPAAVVADAVAAMGVPGLRVRFEPRVRGAYAARGFVVETPETSPRKAGGRARTKHHDHAHPHDHAHDHDHDHHHEHAHRDYAEIRRLLRRAKLDPDAKALAEEVFARVAEVEGALHGTPVDRVAFHEVGAFDSIADIVGASAAIAWLAPVAISSSPVVVGTGTVRTAHGVIPVPAPATAALLAQAPLRFEGTGELTTPTGAALLAAIVDSFGAPPPLRLAAAGYGAGTRELADRANVLRVLVGEPIGAALPPSAEQVVLFEANLDDMSGQMLSALFDALFAAGALDVWSTPIVMKKGRPAQQVSALAAPAQLEAVQRAFFLNSTTLGVRLRPVERAVLARSLADVATPFGTVRVKIGALDGQVLGAEPEFEDCRRRAIAAGVPVKRVWAAAVSAASRLLPAPAGVRARKRSRS
ncbi:MAG TPA: nickel pincer cofactor biosynthesis protein LarC [Polyangia bacterium]|nr:nickel pincer cofactor biosynthesis protein LarC [Polyangia bacterium]